MKDVKDVKDVKGWSEGTEEKKIGDVMRVVEVFILSGSGVLGDASQSHPSPVKTDNKFAGSGGSISTMEDILAQYPTLTTFGFGTFKNERPIAPSDRTFNPERIRILRKTLPLILRPSKKFDVGSYGGKHVAEHFVGTYFSNGEFILAMLMDGYKMRHGEGPNAVFQATYLFPSEWRHPVPTTRPKGARKAVWEQFVRSRAEVATWELQGFPAE